MHYPTDFPFYIQVGDTIDSLSLHQQDHARSNQSHPRQPEDPPNNHPNTNHSLVKNNSTTAPQSKETYGQTHGLSNLEMKHVGKLAIIVHY